MVVKTRISTFLPWIETYLRDAAKPHWQTNERIFTLTPARLETTPAGMYIIRLNRIAINTKRNEQNVIALTVDPRVSTPVIVFEILPHKNGSEMRVTNTSKRFDDFIESVFDAVESRFGETETKPDNANFDKQPTIRQRKKPTEGDLRDRLHEIQEAISIVDNYCTENDVTVNWFFAFKRDMSKIARATYYNYKNEIETIKNQLNT